MAENKVLFSKKPENWHRSTKQATPRVPRLFTGAQNFNPSSVDELSHKAPHGWPVHTLADRARLLKDAEEGIRGRMLIQIDDPAPFVRRITLNRPEKRNAMNHLMRGQLFEALRMADQDPSVRVTIIRGAGDAFCAGYDITMDMSEPLPRHEAGGLGRFQRSVLAMWFMIMDLAKPTIAQVHGHCLAGGSELAAACDMVFVGAGSKIGYPPVRSMGLPDMQIFPWVMGLRQSMYLMLTGDSMTGSEATQRGWATRCFPDSALEAETLRIAQRVARIPSDLLQLNKRSVHRAMESMGMRTHLRMHTDLSALSQETPSVKDFMKRMYEDAERGNKKAFTEALDRRDTQFKDGRTITQSKL